MKPMDKKSKYVGDVSLFDTLGSLLERAEGVTSLKFRLLAKFVGLKLPFTEYGELNVKFIEIDGQESVVEKYVLESV